MIFAKISPIAFYVNVSKLHNIIDLSIENLNLIRMIISFYLLAFRLKPFDLQKEYKIVRITCRITCM